MICSKCKNEDEKLFKEEESIEILKILGLIEICNYFKNVVEEDISQKFRLKNIDETRNYFLEEIKQNELMNKKHKTICTTLNYIEHFLILASTITGCYNYTFILQLYCFFFFDWYFYRYYKFCNTVGLKICAITARIKKRKSITKKKKKKKNHDKIVLLAKSKLNNIEDLISKALIDPVTSHDKFPLINNVLKEYDEMKGEIKNLKDLIKFIEDFGLFIKPCYHIV